jgi:hypothetical protein
LLIITSENAVTPLPPNNTIQSDLDKIAESQQLATSVLQSIESILSGKSPSVFTSDGSLIASISQSLTSISQSLAIIAKALTSPPIVGLRVVFTPNVEESEMKVIKKPGFAVPKATPKATASLALADNGNGTATVYGIDQAGNVVDISTQGVTLTVTSDTPTVATVGTPTGVTFPYGAATSPAPAVGATANYTIVATWPATPPPPTGSPFTDTVAVTITQSAISGIGVTFN